MRRKIEVGPAPTQLIATVPRFGYRLNVAPDRDRFGATFVPPSSTPRQAVVVLPFSATDATLETLATCFTEDLVADLARSFDIPVIAGSIAAGQAARRLGPGPISRKLGGHYAITGTVRRGGSTLRISAHLIDATNGRHLWTERASIEPGEPSIDDRALARFVQALKLQLRIAEGVRAELVGELDAAALMARGRAILLQRDSPETSRMACRFFERALSLDGSSVDAMAALGATLAWIVTSRWSADPVADERRAGELLQQARQAAPGHSEANDGLGSLLRWQGRLAEALEILQLSTAIDRNNPSALRLLGLAYIFIGRAGKALPCMEYAAEIGGDEPTVSATHFAMGACYQSLGHTDEALTWLLKARARNPLLPHVHLRLAAAFGQAGELDQARQELDAARALVAPAARADFATLTAFRSQPCMRHPDFIAQHGPTLFAGLYRAGMVEA